MLLLSDILLVTVSFGARRDDSDFNSEQGSRRSRGSGWSGGEDYDDDDGGNRGRGQGLGKRMKMMKGVRGCGGDVAAAEAG